MTGTRPASSIGITGAATHDPVNRLQISVPLQSASVVQS
jgi:hypothetical protein